ncbi:MAG: hypothetical protein LKI34_03000 [Bifidobacterium tibiigranuli]|uniref:hypothetical protein n=1 Tax=Bifidobacterium tibiigranuli TaxID=2172043 RepID=UPI0026EA36BD|nr:hypothetical protein [Bifidobacterium tibiigranuli]MCI1673175.1 hypothetical protein [Bifidobacterium tibiigranuli]MCI1713580.1 hypothetical protein [Bifidobacterium tibiigranuli]
MKRDDWLRLLALLRRILLPAVLLLAGTWSGVWWVYGLLHGVFSWLPFGLGMLCLTGLLIIGDDW